MAKRNIITVVASVAVVLCIIEIALRLAGIAYPEIHRLDRDLGWSPRPLTRTSAGAGTHAPIEINRAGFRDLERELDKPPGVFRIAVLGDSFVEGREVQFNELFWRVAGDQLSSCQLRQKSVEIIGFGVSGYSTAQELLAYRMQVSKYQPDLVLLAFFTGNDIANNSAALDGHPERPYFELRDGELMLDRSNLDSAAFDREHQWANVGQAIYNRVRIAQLLRQLYLTNKANRKYFDLTLPDQLAADLPSEIYDPPETEAWLDAWRVSEALISRFNREVTAAGAKLWLVLMTNPAQVHPDPDVRGVLADRTVSKDLMYPDRRLGGFTALLGIPAITLAPQLRAYAERHNVTLHGNEIFAGGHWNKLGHAVAGREIARRLCAAYGTDSQGDTTGSLD